MNFEFSEDQLLIKDQVRKFLDERCTTVEVRNVLEGRETFGKEIWQGLGELGLIGTAIPEAYGGAGAGYLELCMVAEEIGRAIAPVPFSSSVYLVVEALLQAGSEEQKSKWLPRLASGEVIGALAVSEGIGNPSPKSIATTFEGGRLTGTKSPVADGGIADVLLVVAKERSGISLVLVDTALGNIERTEIESIDPTRSLAQIDLNGVQGEVLGEPGRGWELLQTVYDRAAILLAFEQIGGAQRALDSAVSYAKERYAFGRPIGSFQAIKHMLANMYVDLELARSNAYYGAWALSTNAAELPEAAATARVSATIAYQNCAKNNIQTHGGMGFTWEFDCHLHYRRSNLLALKIGSQSEWENKLVSSLEARNTVAA